jgi:RNA polymerase sigma-70 factor (ECF subfamily)
MRLKREQRNKKDEDLDLINGIQSGQKDLFYELVKRYEGKIYNFGLKLVRDIGDAEDLVQDTFLNVFRYLKDFRQETKFKNWLYKIASNLCIKKKRKSNFAPDRELSLDDFLPGEDDRTPSEIPDWAALPLEKLLNEELSENLKKSIVSLPEKYRMVFVLRDVEGFNTDETAQILNVSPASVKVRLHRARLFLREKIKEYFTDEP